MKKKFTLPKRLLWVDLEMTGLDASRDVILEIAALVTDDQLNIMARGPEIVIHQSAEVLDGMNDVVHAMHMQSGLIDKVRKSSVSLDDAYKQMLEFVNKECEQGITPLCGNSVWQDRQFLQRYMPALVDFLTYRIIDVSSIKLLINMWYPHNSKSLFKKKESHRALDDIQESIAELNQYKKHFFKG